MPCKFCNFEVMIENYCLNCQRNQSTGRTLEEDDKAIQVENCHLCNALRDANSLIYLSGKKYCPQEIKNCFEIAFKYNSYLMCKGCNKAVGYTINQPTKGITFFCNSACLNAYAKSENLYKEFH